MNIYRETCESVSITELISPINVGPLKGVISRVRTEGNNITKLLKIIIENKKSY